jgi:pyruvate dehydrogenase E2 component (dihydrolipoamide acetyltransferase)
MGQFKMPSLGADMEAGTLVEWLKQPGDTVKRGDIVAVVETEKGAIEVEIFEDGTIGRFLVEPGTKVPVGTPLADILGVAEIVAPAPLPTEAPAPAPPITPLPEVPPLPEAALPPSPAPPPALLVPAGASPAARRLAAERGIDLATIAGTGPGGAIVLEDVERATARAPAAAAPDMGRMRHAIAAAMARSKREIPHYYLTHRLDASAAQQAVTTFNASQSPERRVLIGALLMKAVALALRDFPEFNGFHGPDGRKASEAIHVGMAIALRGGGLAAPAIHDTDKLSVPELMDKMRDLVGRVRKGGFRSSEISDPTVTVTSLGERGVEALLPVIYPPQVAIVGFGALLERPWVMDGRVEPRAVLTMSLAADHRTSDGHRGALFLRRIEELLERPEALWT